jgi:hypothetical protein
MYTRIAAFAAVMLAALPTVAHAQSSNAWGGYYAGGHLGYGQGKSTFSPSRSPVEITGISAPIDLCKSPKGDLFPLTEAHRRHWLAYCDIGRGSSH